MHLQARTYHPVLGGDLVQQGSAENSSAAAVEPVGSSVVGAVAVPVEQRRLGARRRRRLSDAEVRLVSLEDDWVRARGLTSQRGALASAMGGGRAATTHNVSPQESKQEHKTQMKITTKESTSNDDIDNIDSNSIHNSKHNKMNNDSNH